MFSMNNRAITARQVLECALDAGDAFVANHCRLVIAQAEAGWWHRGTEQSWAIVEAFAETLPGA